MYNNLTDALFPPFILIPVNLHTQSYQMLTYEDYFLYTVCSLLFPFVLSNDIMLAFTICFFKLFSNFSLPNQ